MSKQAELGWFKSSYSSSQNDACLEVAVTAETIHVRDSKDVTVPALALSPHAWSAFVAGLTGEARR